MRVTIVSRTSLNWSRGPFFQSQEFDLVKPGVIHVACLGGFYSESQAGKKAIQVAGLDCDLLLLFARILDVVKEVHKSCREFEDGDDTSGG